MEKLYSYNLPENLIAKKPANPRDSSRLLICDLKNDKIFTDTFRNITKYLPKNSALVMNQSKVLPVRLECYQVAKEDLELLVLLGECDNHILKGIVNRRLFKEEEIFIAPDLKLKVLDASFKVYKFQPNFPMKDLEKVLKKYGRTPIPKYIEHENLSEDFLRKKYQTIFAKNPGSAAAPTASLHFTPRVFKSLEEKCIPHHFVTLHVGLGTFAPVLPEHRESGKFYEETFEIPESTLKNIEGKNVVAVGTTVVRTLETYGKTHSLSGKSDLFIQQYFKFRIVDSLITNFHLPGSSLMMLVEAFLHSKGSKRRLKEIYEFAIKENFRFYSFGDAMLII